MVWTQLRIDQLISKIKTFTPDQLNLIENFIMNQVTSNDDFDPDIQKTMTATTLKSEDDIKAGRTMTTTEAKQRLRARFK